VSKNINNPVGMGGGGRKKLSRAERQNNGPHRNLDRQGAADRKAELVRKMREKAAAAEGAGQTGDNTVQHVVRALLPYRAWLLRPALGRAPASQPSNRGRRRFSSPSRHHPELHPQRHRQRVPCA
jgi:hypothetical protein